MKLEDVQKNYDHVAMRYDRWTDIAFGRLLRIERLRQHTVELLGDVRGKIVLDVGCGTGRNLPFLVSQVGANGRIIGIDYSQGMLDVARARVARNGWKNVELRRDDAAKLASIDIQVDAVVSVWCLGIVHDLDASLRRTLDLLRPGGHIALMDFDRARPEQGVLRYLYPIYHAMLQWAGIDEEVDLDDLHLQEKWNSGRAILERRLEHLTQERYLSGIGFILSGAIPA